jgi:hypothetical protein
MVQVLLPPALILSLLACGCSQKMDSQTPLPTLLAKASDWELCDATFVKISDRYNNRVYASKYTPEERVVMLVWHASGLIGNGGFDYLFSGDFEGDPGFRLTAEAFSTVGLTRSHEAFEEAFKLFPEGHMPEDAEQRMVVFKGIDEAVRESLNQKVWLDDSEKTIETKLAGYIRGNARTFSHLK